MKPTFSLCYFSLLNAYSLAVLIKNNGGCKQRQRTDFFPFATAELSSVLQRLRPRIKGFFPVESRSITEPSSAAFVQGYGTARPCQLPPSCRSRPAITVSAIAAPVFPHLNFVGCPLPHQAPRSLCHACCPGQPSRKTHNTAHPASTPLSGLNLKGLNLLSVLFNNLFSFPKT